MACFIACILKVSVLFFLITFHICSHSSLSVGLYSSELDAWFRFGSKLPLFPYKTFQCNWEQSIHKDVSPRLHQKGKSFNDKELINLWFFQEGTLNLTRELYCGVEFSISDASMLFFSFWARWFVSLSAPKWCSSIPCANVIHPNNVQTSLPCLTSFKLSANWGCLHLKSCLSFQGVKLYISGHFEHILLLPI